MSDTPPPEGFTPLADTQFMVVFEDPQRRVLLAVRKRGAPMPAEEVRQAHRELVELAPEKTKGWGLLIDTREVTGNNDPRFEAAIQRINVLLFEHFTAMAVLVRSVIGELHAARLSKAEVVITSDFDQALTAVTRT